MNKRELEKMIKGLIEEAINSNFDNDELFNRDIYETADTDYTIKEKKYILNIIKNWYENFNEDGPIKELFYYIKDIIEYNNRREYVMFSDWVDTFDQFAIYHILQEYKRLDGTNLLDKELSR